MPLIYYITVFVQYNEIISDKNDFFEENIKKGLPKKYDVIAVLATAIYKCL